MSKAQHTPGPWRLDSAKEDTSVIGPDGKFVVAGEYDGYMCPFSCREYNEAMANARLIAAAPDMLSALRRAVLALAFAAEASDAMRDDYAAVSAVIAKATGATETKEYAWECNECGSQQYTMAVSEDDVHTLGCNNCGGDEWHKAEAKGE